MLDDYQFAVCLTHDVDRPYESFQAPYYALRNQDPARLQTLLASDSPYWQFDTIMALEDDLDVRSTFYFLQEKRLLEKPVREWVKPANWMLYTGRYDITDDKIAAIIRDLDRGGWEIGLHGSYDSYRDENRLRSEKATLESVLGEAVIGCRQHYLNLERPETWEYQHAIGLQYDSSLGSATSVGFEYGYQPLQPFDDDFVVFPPTIMDAALMEGTSFEEAQQKCIDLLNEAQRNNAVMTIDWHPKTFYERDFPGYQELYTKIIRVAKDLGGWVGPCRELYHSLKQQASGNGINVN